MAKPRASQPTLSAADDVGVRVIAKTAGARASALTWVVSTMAVVAAVTAAALAWLFLAPRSAQSADTAVAQTNAARNVQSTAAGTPPASTRPSLRRVSFDEPQVVPGNDPDDLAAYFQPGDPEPTGAELIEALQHAGIRTGLGAFNPPGTSPPLTGLAVPDGYALPDGYVRHHQVTDEGEPIEPILMFSPDFTLYDAQGKPIAMPADRVVPPSLAPPGLPLRRIQIPKP